MTAAKKPLSAVLTLSALEDRITPSGTSDDPYQPPPPPPPAGGGIVVIPPGAQPASKPSASQTS